MNAHAQQAVLNKLKTIAPHIPKKGDRNKITVLLQRVKDGENVPDTEIIAEKRKHTGLITRYCR